MTQCPFMYEDGERCADQDGHDAYDAKDRLGHRRSEVEPPEMIGHHQVPQAVPDCREARATSVSPMGRLAVVALTAAMLGTSEPMGRPRSPGLPPLPRNPEDPPPLPTKLKSGNPYGRLGTQPLPRAFHSSRLMPGEDPGLPDLQKMLNQQEQADSDERHMTAAEAKRERKRIKRRLNR